MKEGRRKKHQLNLCPFWQSFQDKLLHLRSIPWHQYLFLTCIKYTSKAKRELLAPILTSKGNLSSAKETEIDGLLALPSEKRIKGKGETKAGEYSEARGPSQSLMAKYVRGRCKQGARFCIPVHCVSCTSLSPWIITRYIYVNVESH